jgi:heme exporter protein C
MVASVLYLKDGKSSHDYLAGESANMGLVFGILGLVTGMLWAEFTWGKYWSNDPKQIMSAVGLLIYLAYVILRSSFSDDQMKARVSAIFNILAFPTFLVLIFVLPRLTDSLHPGNGGNPAFNKYDLNFKMRLVFYPAIAAFTMLGIWIVSLKVRIKLLENKINDGN